MNASNSRTAAAGMPENSSKITTEIHGKVLQKVKKQRQQHQNIYCPTDFCPFNSYGKIRMYNARSIGEV
jgi:hypothetical protein